MCTKTKTSFGCGHCIKDIERCGIPNCETLEKWKIPKPGDCPKCKVLGENLTRGKDGRGRYGKGQSRQRDSRQSSADDHVPVKDSPGSAHMAVSPWAPKTPEVPQEKRWTTPTRQKADNAWVIEHERRMSDLDEKTAKLSLQLNQHGSRRASPRASYERDLEIIELFEEPDEIEVSPSRSRVKKLLPYEVEEASRANSRRQSRKNSHNSEEFLPHHEEVFLNAPRRKTHFVTPVSEYNPPEHHDMPRKPHRPGPRTEPYLSQACCYEPPVITIPTNHGNWAYRYTNMQQPVYREAYYPRSNQVC